MMEAMEIAGVDGHFALRSTQRPMPQPGPEDVLIRVRAAGVNGHDVHQVHRGSHPLDEGETDLPGLEVAGEIVAVGASVEESRAGDRVCALLRGGGYAEFAIAREALCLPIPTGLNWVQAAALPEACFTVWSNVFIDGRLEPGESFLMNGGTSGIGVTAIQIVSALGHRVFATARGAQKCGICRDLGAARAIDYETEDFVAVVMGETGGKGVDLILEIVGGDYLPKDVDALATGGRMILIGAARGSSAEIDFNKVARKRLQLSGSLLRPRPIADKRQAREAILKHVWPLIAQGRIRPQLDSTFPLEKAASALARLESRSHVGKVVLTV
jgi:NADPH2:quinone reductase